MWVWGVFWGNLGGGGGILRILGKLGRNVIFEAELGRDVIFEAELGRNVICG